jgi:chemotaxis protein histidine kinase CheA
MLFSSFAAKKWTVLKLISWKHSFKILNEESEMTKKKKQALDNLLSTGRISQSTYEQFNKEINNAIAEIEKQQNTLLDKMNSTTEQLEGQIKTLEMLLANFEIQHVTGEVEDETYQREISLLSVGLETARQELDIVKEAINQLISGIQTPAADAVIKQEAEPQPKESIEVPTAEAKIVEQPVPIVEEKLQETSECAEGSESNSSHITQEEKQEVFKSADESQPTETNTEGEEKQET